MRDVDPFCLDSRPLGKRPRRGRRREWSTWNPACRTLILASTMRSWNCHGRLARRSETQFRWTEADWAEESVTGYCRNQMSEESLLRGNATRRRRQTLSAWRRQPGQSLARERPAAPASQKPAKRQGSKHVRRRTGKAREPGTGGIVRIEMRL